MKNLWAAALAAAMLAVMACGPATRTVAGSQAAGSSGGASALRQTPAASQGSAANLGGIARQSPLPVVKGTPAASQSYPQYVQGTIPAQVNVSFTFGCVKPGLGQTITIKTTPGFYVAFDTQYADGKDGQKHGGWGYTVMPNTGSWTQAWTVDPSTPPGQAIAFVSVEGGKPVQTAFRQPAFQVGSC